MQPLSAQLFHSVTLTHSTLVKQTCKLILVKPVSVNRSTEFNRATAMRQTRRGVRLYVTKCPREQTTETSSINFGKNRHVDRVSADFQPNRQRP